jgi:ATP-dependent exoDNAse (exonuclease V) alpha subunit
VGLHERSLGVITKPHPKGTRARFDDGAEDPITTADLEKLTHGWAISVHKTQRSTFKWVIIPVVRSKLLDRTMLYTAITRGMETVVLDGDINLIGSRRLQRAYSGTRRSGVTCTVYPQVPPRVEYARSRPSPAPSVAG